MQLRLVAAAPEVCVLPSPSCVLNLFTEVEQCWTSRGAWTAPLESAGTWQRLQQVAVEGVALQSAP